jgi:hypothetical protein
MRLIIRGILFALTAALGLHASVGHAQGVTLRCGGGTVQTAGFVINNLGEVVFSENSIACNVQQAGLPDALALAITAPLPGVSINVSSGPQVLPFAGTINNYTASVDACQVRVIPPAPGTPWPPVVLQPNVAGVVSANINFAQGLQAGNYTLELSCAREVNDQQVIVPTVTRAVTVVNQGGGNPDECQSEPIPEIFSPVIQTNFSAAFVPDAGMWGTCNVFGTGGFGVPVNSPVCARYHQNTNQMSSGALTQVGLKTYKFRPTANTKVKLLWGNGSSPGVAISISTCPGKFAGLPSACTSTASLTWATPPQAGWCQLDPTKDYYLNYAHFNLPTFLSTGDYVPVETCAGSNCTLNHHWKVQNDVQFTP